MNKQTRLYIEKIADSVRDECNVTDYGFQNIFDATEKLGFRVIRFPINEEALLGFALIKEDERIIFTNSTLILSREIFSAAHEIGHQKLHLNEQGRRLIKDNDFNDRDEDEIEANYFAASLLMPVEKVEKFIRLELKNKSIDSWSGLDIARIQTAFNVSYDMVLNRLESLRFIDETLKNKLALEKYEKTTRKLLNTINGNVDLCKPMFVKRVPAEYLEWVISNFNDKLIPIESLERVLNYLDLKVDDFEGVLNAEFTEEDESFDELFRRME